MLSTQRVLKPVKIRNLLILRHQILLFLSRISLLNLLQSLSFVILISVIVTIIIKGNVDMVSWIELVVCIRLHI